ncbi:hypothetical protein HOB10_05675 [Candidatus Parcubacteria bacterium]|jgi:hypothetical protein|nr:hypothetical protein [bacterium]MBT6691787.1 hypothetical protein [Candidatus Parcubacteria bacterium]
MNLLQELLTAAQEIDPKSVQMDDTELTETQTSVGTMSDDTLRIFGLLRQTAGTLEPMINEIRGLEKGSERYDELKLEISQLKLRCELIQEIFWKAVRLEFPEIIDKDIVGCRQGGMVYWEPSDNHGLGIEVISVGIGGPMSGGLADLFRS